VRRVFLLGCVSLVLCAVSGCGSAKDNLFKALISEMNELSDAIEKDAPEAKIAALQDKIKETSGKLDALGLSGDDKKKLIDKYKLDLTKTAERLAKVSKDKGIKVFAGAGVVAQ
jgi:peptidoglycan hydrolase CwlO-like protein